MYYSPYFQPQMPQMSQVPQQMPQNHVTMSEMVSVSSENMARNYPVAHGNSVTFKNENAPYIYTKTMGFSQLDQPIFKKYKLIEEEEEEMAIMPTQSESYALQADLNKLVDEVTAIRDEINILKSKRHTPERKEVSDDE